MVSTVLLFDQFEIKLEWQLDSLCSLNIIFLQVVDAYFYILHIVGFLAFFKDLQTVLKYSSLVQWNSTTC